jgi:hypothetical protein
VHCGFSAASGYTVVAEVKAGTAARTPSCGQASVSYPFVEEPHASYDGATKMTPAVYFGGANAGFQAGFVNGPVSATFHLPPGEYRPSAAGPEHASTN